MTNTPSPTPLSRRDAACAKFARAAVFEAFGRHGHALDQDDFTDRKPWEQPLMPPTDLESSLYLAE
jgi:hypothetical protein